MKKIFKSFLASILVITMLLPNFVVLAATRINYSEERFSYIPSERIVLDNTEYLRLTVKNKYEGLSQNDIIFADSNFNLVTDRNLIEKLAYVNMIKSNIIVGSDALKITNLADAIVEKSEIIESLGNTLIESTLGNAITGNFKGLLGAFRGDPAQWTKSYLDFVAAVGADTFTYLSYVAIICDLMYLCTENMTELSNFYASSTVKNIDKKGLSYTDAQKYERIVRNCMSSLNASEYYVDYLAKCVSGNNVNNSVDAFDIIKKVTVNGVEDIVWDAIGKDIGKPLADTLANCKNYNEFFSNFKKTLKVSDKLSTYYNSYVILDPTSYTYIDVNDVIKNVKTLTGATSSIPTSSTSSNYIIGNSNEKVYNAASAVNYAATHWNDGKGLCAEFVSDCIKAGGSSAWYRGCTTLVRLLKEEGLGTLYELTLNSDGTISESKNAGKISAGDPIFVYCSNSLKVDNYPYEHVYLASETNANGYWKGYAHNNALNNGVLCAKFTCPTCKTVNTDKAFSFHFNTSSSSASLPTTKANLEEGLYSITNGIHTLNAVKDVDATGTVNGDYTAVTRPSKRWYLIKEGDTYILMSQSSYNSGNKRVLNVWTSYSTDSRNGYEVSLYTKSSDLTQRWTIDSCGSGYILHPADNSSLSMTLNGTWIYVNNNNQSSSQIWQFEKVGSLPSDLRTNTSKEYYLDLNAYLDGEGVTWLDKFGTADVYINGKCVANDVNDYYTMHPVGTTYEIKDIKAKNGYTYNGVNGNTPLKGTIQDGKVSVFLNFSTYVPKTYTICYNANGGSSAPEAQTKTEKTVVSISTQKPTRDGYAFSGWATTSSGSAVYKAGQSYSADADITLYAVWEANTYTISYNANGGNGAPSSQSKKHGTNITLSAQEPKRDGYVFIGWSTAADGGVAFAPGTTCAENRNITLYALWQQEENEVYYIIYNANGGSGAPSMQAKNENEDIKISSEMPIRSGYTFAGWAVGTEGDVKYSSGDVYKENKTLYLHAVWTANTYTISYNANGGSSAPQNQTKTHDEPITLSNINPTKENSKFVGWASAPDAKSAVYFAGDVFEQNADTLLYAVWEEIINEEEVAEDVHHQEALPFEDVPESAWYRQDVESAYRSGLINGKSERRYAPNDNITYAEAIKLACTIYQLYFDGEVTLSNGSDVWYSTYMNYAIENRIVRTDYSSIANKYATRKEFVSIFYGALPLKEFATKNEIKDDSIPDVKIGDAYAGEIYTFYRAGILTGNDTKGTFNPERNISRSEVAALVTRMLDRGSRKEARF